MRALRSLAKRWMRGARAVARGGARGGRPVLEPLEPRVLLSSVTLGDDVATHVLTEPDGDAIHVRLEGPGSAELERARSETGADAGLAEIELSNTSSRTRLSISVERGGAGADGIATLERVEADAPLGELVMPDVDVEGDGVRLPGAAERLRMGSLGAATSIVVGDGPRDARLRLRAVEGADDAPSRISVAGDLRALRVAGSARGLEARIGGDLETLRAGAIVGGDIVANGRIGELRAASIRGASIAASAAGEIASIGELEASLRLDGDGVGGGPTLAGVRVGGDLTAMPDRPEWRIGGRLGTVRVRGAVKDLAIVGTTARPLSGVESIEAGALERSELRVDGRIGRLAAEAIRESRVEAHEAGRLEAPAGIAKSELVVRGAEPARVRLERLEAGPVRDATIRVAGAVESLMVAQVADSAVEASTIGVLATRGDFSGSLDLTGAANRPAIQRLVIGGGLGGAGGGGSISVDGNAGLLDVGGTIADARIDVSGALGRLRAQGGITGARVAVGAEAHEIISGRDVAGARVTVGGDLGRLSIAGPVEGSDLLAGAALDTDTDLAAGRFAPAAIDRVAVDGAVRDAVIAAGGAPGADGAFADGEILAGGRIESAVIEGVIAGDDSRHPNPGLYAARFGSLTVSGESIHGKSASAVTRGAAVVDPLPANVALAVPDVEAIVERAATRARNLGVNATISVIDREGNLLGVVRTAFGADPDGAPIGPAAQTVEIEAGGERGLEAIDGLIPTSLIAATKAGTAAFLSTSDGNAFTTRTAAYIIRRHFPPGVSFQDGGPLFGVQLSSLPTSDVNRLPLGLSADPGGMPLYRGGELVGGIGVEVDGTYAAERSPLRSATTLEERVALAGQAGLAPPDALTADKVFIDGIRLAFGPGDPPAPDSLSPLVDYDARFDGTPQELVAPQTSPGSMFSGGVELGGIEGEIPDASLANGNRGLRDFYNGPSDAGADGFAFERGAVGLRSDNTRPAAADAFRLTPDDVESILAQGHRLNDRLRAAIRRDDPKISEVNVSVVDVNGELLGTFRTPDAPVFGYDVSVQKARTAAFFSRPDAGEEIRELDGEVDVAGLQGLGTVGGAVAEPYGRHVDALNDVGLTLDGRLAVADRTGGFLSRPNLPDGIDGEGPGPFAAQPPGAYSPFNTGLQTSLILPELAELLEDFNGMPESAALGAFDDGSFPGLRGAVPLSGTNDGASGEATPGGAQLNPGDRSGLPARSLANGMQIFAGSVPLYKNGVLVGGVGVSGDGIEQDDMIAFAAAGGFLSSDDPGFFQEFGDGVTRADRMRFDANGDRIRLPYVKFPRAPFRGT